MARIDAILKLVKEQGASDLHMTTGSAPMVRINGEITPIPYEPLTREVSELLLFEIMDPPTRARYDAHKDVDFSYEVPGVVRARCNIYEQSKGPAGAFRMLPSQILTMEQLGLPEQIAKLTELPRGLIVCTGPPGTGKSSTLAALLDHINANRRKHILTIEDPIEYKHVNKQCLITQREVGRNTPSFAKALHGALREDPDVIMVGEMRDVETMALAMTAAATGQLVFATLHTMSATQTVDRILDSFDGERQAQARLMLSESLKGVLAQRLLRRRDGQGRALALEVLVGTPAVAALIREKKTFQLQSVLQTGRKEGMQTMDEAVIALVREGTVAPEDAIAHLSSKELLPMLESVAPPPARPQAA
ncbi:MAG: PilT/PilU family type 4a pilus ATPase [Candidatus Eisenbacteria bacterium]